MGLLWTSYKDSGTKIISPSTVVHQENRAPTDESVKILKEMAVSPGSK